MGEFLCNTCYSQLDFSLNDFQPNLKVIYLDQVQALLKYDSLSARMIHHNKYKGVRDLSETFAYWLYQFAKIPDCDAITYIPIHHRRLKERGYNQAKLIAELLAQRLNLPCLPLLKRTIYRQKQALSHNVQQRQSKSENIFVIQGENFNWQKKYPRILILDDVLTTGATMNEAAKTLKTAGFNQVFGLALAHGA